jgi:hypothetical protein
LLVRLLLLLLPRLLLRASPSAGQVLLLQVLPPLLQLPPLPPLLLPFCQSSTLQCL